MKKNRGLYILLIILLILVADQALKFWVKTHMALGDEFSVIGNWFLFHFVENPGMAFGVEFAGEYGKLFLSIFRIFAVTVIGWYLFKLTKKKVTFGFLVSVSLIFTGALGNIIDSIFYGMIFSHSYGQEATFLPEGGGYGTFLYGKVVDMFYFPIIQGAYPDWFPFWGGQKLIFFRPVFNIADSAITTGIFSIILFHRKYFAAGFPEESENENPAGNPSGKREEIVEKEQFIAEIEEDAVT
ncbi:MAG: lipoprotein signal peptidase [Prolixibacteraceae bacterium]|nr:lipoprotein signal peptidase [Prolixibacteraceae bacterium]